MDYEPVLYRGIDFVLITRKPTTPLTDELAKHVIFNRVWKGTRRITICGGGQTRSVESDITWFCHLIENLSPKSVRCWKACSSRLIDIGIDSGNVRHGDKLVSLNLQISPATLKRISDIQGKLVITVYPYVNGTGSIPAALPQ